MSEEENAREFRKEILSSCGASSETMEELLAYTENPFKTAGDAVGRDFPLADEPHLEAWVRYEEEARQIGVFEALKKRFVQLQFPIRSEISQDESYRSATRRGSLEASAAFSPGLVLDRPSELELVICPTIAGKIPVIVAGDREDFVALVRAFTNRNEPEPVPKSMGACIVTGLNNWDRIATHRRAWEQGQGQASPATEEAWSEEFRRLIPRKELYQDRFIILSRGPYSATEARDVGLDDGKWQALSLVIRREHEFTHYFTYRVFGTMRNNLLDELIADFVGLVRSLGRYRSDLALRFLGLESFPRYREGGRLESYRGQPPLSDGAMEVLRCLAVRAVRNLDLFSARNVDAVGDLTGLARLTYALAGLTVEEMASGEMIERAAARLS